MSVMKTAAISRELRNLVQFKVALTFFYLFTFNYFLYLFEIFISYPTKFPILCKEFFKKLNCYLFFRKTVWKNFFDNNVLVINIIIFILIINLLISNFLSQNFTEKTLILGFSINKYNK